MEIEQARAWLAALGRTRLTPRRTSRPKSGEEFAMNREVRGARSTRRWASRVVIAAIGGVAGCAFLASTAAGQSHRVSATKSASRIDCAKATRTNHAQAPGSPSARTIADLKVKVANGWTLTSAGRTAIAGGDPRTKAPAGSVVLAMGPHSNVMSSRQAGLMHKSRTTASARVAQRSADTINWGLGCPDSASVTWEAPGPYDWHWDTSSWWYCTEEDCYGADGVSNLCYGQCEYFQWFTGDELWVVSTFLSISADDVNPEVLEYEC